MKLDSEQVLDRGEKIEFLVDKTENLQFQVLPFAVDMSHTLRNKKKKKD